MTLRSLLTGVPLAGEVPALDMEITSISYDTRTLKPGALFAALPGAEADGGAFIEEALRRGAAAVLCREPPDREGPWIRTEDPRLALALIACNWFGRPGDEMTLVGVTGTNGKTTTTHLLKELLERVRGGPVGLIGTSGNRIGAVELPAHRTTPESWELQRLLRQMADAGCTCAVMEVSSHALVQHRTAGLTFDAGVFTNLTRDHLDYHRTMEAYRDAKGLLFQQSRTAVLNLDDEAGRWYRDRISGPVFTYSESRMEADLTAANLQLFPERVQFEAVIRGEIARIRVPIPGGFTIYNALAALSAGLVLGLPLKEMARAFPDVHGVKGRVEPVPVPRDYSVIIDYAHSPDALENILMTARRFTRNRLICLFGCGGDRDRGKRPRMGAIAQELADLVIVTSDNPRGEAPESIIREILAGMDGWDRVLVEPDRVRAIRMAMELGQSGDVIVLAGKGHETYQEICGERIPLDERDVISAFFREKDRTKMAGNPPVAMV